MILVCQLINEDKIMDLPKVKISVRTDSSLIDIDDHHLRPENAVITKELVRKFNINSLEPILFEMWDAIRLSH